MAAERGPGAVVGEGLFRGGMILGVVVWGLLSLLTTPFPYRIRYGFVMRWCRWIVWWLRVTRGVRYEVEGLEHVSAEPGIVMCKHQSVWETLALSLWFHPQTWVLKRELLWLPIFGWALALLRPIAIDRGAGQDALRQVVAQGRRRLAAGRWIVVFPEGTRIPAGQRGHYRVGGAILARRTGAMVVPVAHNAGEHWPKRGRKRPGVIRVRIGPPIPAQGKRPTELMAEVEHWIEAQMPALSSGPYTGELYQAPAGRPI